MQGYTDNRDDLYQSVTHDDLYHPVIKKVYDLVQWDDLSLLMLCEMPGPNGETRVGIAEMSYSGNYNDGVVYLGIIRQSRFIDHFDPPIDIGNAYLEVFAEGFDAGDVLAVVTNSEVVYFESVGLTLISRINDPQAIKHPFGVDNRHYWKADKAGDPIDLYMHADFMLQNMPGTGPAPGSDYPTWTWNWWDTEQSTEPGHSETPVQDEYPDLAEAGAKCINYESVKKYLMALKDGRIPHNPEYYFNIRALNCLGTGVLTPHGHCEDRAKYIGRFTEGKAHCQYDTTCMAPIDEFGSEEYVPVKEETDIFCTMQSNPTYSYRYYSYTYGEQSDSGGTIVEFQEAETYRNVMITEDIGPVGKRFVRQYRGDYAIGDGFVAKLSGSHKSIASGDWCQVTGYTRGFRLYGLPDYESAGGPAFCYHGGYYCQTDKNGHRKCIDEGVYFGSWPDPMPLILSIPPVVDGYSGQHEKNICIKNNNYDIYKFDAGGNYKKTQIGSGWVAMGTGAMRGDFAKVVKNLPLSYQGIPGAIVNGRCVVPLENPYYDDKLNGYVILDQSFVLEDNAEDAERY